MFGLMCVCFFDKCFLILLLLIFLFVMVETLVLSNVQKLSRVDIILPILSLGSLRIHHPLAENFLRVLMV